MAGLTTSVLLIATASAQAQTPPPVSPAQFDPSDVYFQAYLAKRDAERLEESGDFVGASEKLRAANKLMEGVRTYYPAWKPEMVGGSISKNSDTLARLFTRAEEQKKNQRKVTAELEGGEKTSGTLIDPAEGVMPLKPGVLDVNPMDAKRLREAEAEVERLKNLTKPAPTTGGETSRDLSRVNDMARQRDFAQAQLRAAENSLQSLRARLAASPVESEMKAIEQRIAGLEQERDAMGMALTQSRARHTEALAEIATLQADRGVMQQKYSNLDRDLKVQEKVSNEVVAGQRTQLMAMEKELAQKNLELGKAHERINNLVKELEESRESFAQIRTERDSLLEEREQMNVLLNFNRDGQINHLIQQNLGLSKSLNEAKETVERLNLDNNSTKDEVIAAKQNLAIAKSQINRLQQEKRDQDQRLEDLEKRLRGEERSLAGGNASSNPEEVRMLREIIRKQLAVQERRRQASDLMVQAAKDMGGESEEMDQAIKLLDGQDVQLTPDEQQLLADRQVDGVFISPFAQDRDTVGRNTDALNRDISVLERTAEKSYSAGRLLPTRELFEMIMEQHPGHIPTLCKLGVVDLKLNDPTAAVDKFRRAVELEANNPYAHRMLGYSLFLLGDLAAAEQEFKTAIQILPDDAKSYFLLAKTTLNLGRAGEAEANFKASIAADPMPNEGYIALAVLCARDKRLDQAKEYYQQALERGAVPDPKLEERLVTQ
ncbi:tetratricopeptide repeat protein [Luteolibacter yonseiensis]|uniref:Tetratricopeptide repeat protein n=2 Tax=Luteolibacter yonseiensis TaxID=1144680 RepID=A0A934VC42_9BACT|nr:tetratricopeptide repeat protein [Luteolibacter yonseiensis]